MSSSLPFVILCAKCNSIVSDSFCNISTSEDLQVFISDKTTNITTGKQIKLATGGSDEGSSYFDLACSECQEVIGKVYMSTTDATDAYRNKSAISFSKVKTYVLGSCILENTDPKSSLGMMHGGQLSNSILLSFDAERAANDASELKRIQAVIVNLNKRVERMESKQL